MKSRIESRNLRDRKSQGKRPAPRQKPARKFRQRAGDCGEVPDDFLVEKREPCGR